MLIKKCFLLSKLSIFSFQVVLGRPVAEVAKNVIQWVRLPILSPEELEKCEKENKKDNIITVSEILILPMYI